jgi:hypothetical protein
MTAIANHPHRVTSAIAAVRSELASVAEVPVWSMDAAETTDALAEVRAAKAQLAELEARLLCHADRTEVGNQGNATSTAKWLAVTAQTTRPESHRLLRIAKSLEANDQTRTARRKVG